jgi:hypothetical protein
MVVMLAIGVAAFAAPPAESAEIDIFATNDRCGADPHDTDPVPSKSEVCYDNLLEVRIFVEFPPGVIEGGVTQISVNPGMQNCVTLGETAASGFEYKVYKDAITSNIECTDTENRPRIIIDRGHRDPEREWIPTTREYE